MIGQILDLQWKSNGSTQQVVFFPLKKQQQNNSFTNNKKVTINILWQLFVLNRTQS